MFPRRVPMCGNYLAQWGLTRSLSPEATASPRASCPARISRRSSLWSGCEGHRPRSRARVTMPVGHGLGGVLLQRTQTGKLQTIGAENTREGPREPPSRDLREKTRQVSEKDKESQAWDSNSSSKTSNRNEQANCRKQMKRPHPAPILVFDVFSPAQS